MSNKTGKTLSWTVVDKNGTTMENRMNFDHLPPQQNWFDENQAPRNLSRKSARAFKNFLNALIPERAPFRIAQTVITK